MHLCLLKSWPGHDYESQLKKKKHNLRVENYISFSRFAEDLRPIAEDLKGFSGGSNGKESACNVGDQGLIPGLRRPPGEGNGNAL